MMHSALLFATGGKCKTTMSRDLHNHSNLLHRELRVDTDVDKGLENFKGGA